MSLSISSSLWVGTYTLPSQLRCHHCETWASGPCGVFFRISLTATAKHNNGQSFIVILEALLRALPPVLCASPGATPLTSPVRSRPDTLVSPRFTFYLITKICCETSTMQYASIDSARAVSLASSSEDLGTGSQLR